MKNYTNNKKGIDRILDKLGLVKSKPSDKFEEEEYEEEFDIEDEEIEEDEDLEKSEEDEEIEEDDYLELEYDELVTEVIDQVVELITPRLQELEDKINGLEENQSDQIDVTEEIVNKVDEVEKSLRTNQNLRKSVKEMKRQVDHLSKSRNLRKSVRDFNIIDKYPEPKKNADDLSKSKKAEILVRAIGKGERGITAADVTRAELTGVLSDNAREIIENNL